MLSAIAKERLRRHRAILFSKDDEGIHELMLRLEAAPRKAAVLWALEMAEEGAALLALSLPEDGRAEYALNMSRAWAAGQIKMPAAKRAILDCHAAAKECEDPRDAALFHAVGQACSTVHTARHAIGYVLYALTAEVCGGDFDGLENSLLHFSQRLDYHLEHYADNSLTWAAFIEESK